MKILYQAVFMSYLAIALFLGFDNSAIAVITPSISDMFNAGIINLQEQNYDQALVNFSQAIAQPGNLTGAAYSNRCLVNLQLQHNTAAEADCLRAIEYNSHNLEAHLNLGLAYYRQGKYPSAIAQYQKVIQQDTNDYRAYYNRGLVYLALNDSQSAITDYQTALNHSTDSDTESQSLIYNDLALARIMSGQTRQAIANITQAIALNDNNYSAYYNRGCAYHQLREYKAAIKDFSQAVQLNPNFTQAYVHRGILNRQIGATKVADQDFNIALKQYHDQGNREQYDLVSNLKQKLFYSQAHRLV